MWNVHNAWLYTNKRLNRKLHKDVDKSAMENFRLIAKCSAKILLLHEQKLTCSLPDTIWANLMWRYGAPIVRNIPIKRYRTYTQLNVLHGYNFGHVVYKWHINPDCPARVESYWNLTCYSWLVLSGRRGKSEVCALGATSALLGCQLGIQPNSDVLSWLKIIKLIITNIEITSG